MYKVHHQNEHASWRTSFDVNRVPLIIHQLGTVFWFIFSICCPKEKAKKIVQRCQKIPQRTLQWNTRLYCTILVFGAVHEWTWENLLLPAHRFYSCLRSSRKLCGSCLVPETRYGSYTIRKRTVLLAVSAFLGSEWKCPKALLACNRIKHNTILEAPSVKSERQGSNSRSLFLQL